MPDDRRVTCQICKRHTSEVGPISWRGKCEPCGRRRAVQSMDDLHFHQGEFFGLWRRGMAACVGAVLPEDS